MGDDAIDGGAVSSPLAKLSQDEWREARLQVRRFAIAIARSPTQADEVTQEAFARLWTTRAWDPVAEPSLARHVIGIVKSLPWDGPRSRQRRRETASLDQAATEGVAAPSAEAGVVERQEKREAQERAARLLAALRAKLAGHPLELSLLDLTAEGVDNAALQAQNLGRSREDVYRARERIQRFMKTILATDAQQDDEVA